MPLDPVCGMFVRDGPRAIHAHLGGHRYLFCSRGCQRRFTAPARELVRMKRRAALALGGGAALLALPRLGVVPEPALGALVLALGTVVLVVAGAPFFAGIRQAVRMGAPNMDTLIAVGTTAAWVFGAVEVMLPEMLVPGRQVYYFEVSALVLGFVAAGRALEQRLHGAASSEVGRLLELQPPAVHVLRDGEEREVPAEDVVPDDVVVVLGGERFPVDGVVLAGEGAVDEKLLTGEGLPVDKRPGDRVLGGSVNRGAPLQVRATQVGGGTALARIVSLVGQARTTPAPFQRSADRVSAWLVPVALGVALLALAGWYLVAGAPLPFAFSAFVAVLLIACPSALGLAAPAALAVGVSRGTRRGMLIKDAEVLERFQRVDVVVFDKTGTITRGEPALTDVVPFGRSEAELLALAASAEQGSEHPLGRTMVRAAQARGLPLQAPTRVHVMPGVGLESTVDGADVLVGSPRLLAECRVDTRPAQDDVRRLQEQGKTTVLVAENNRLAGLLAFADPLRPEAVQAVRRLQARGMEVCIMTGDAAPTAQAVARQLGVRRSFAEITPVGKAGVVRGLQAGGHVVAMVGDGVNDAPALAAADVGVAIGAGAEVALEAADVVLMRNDPRDVPDAVDLGHQTVGKVRQNLRWAYAYNLGLVPVAALGLLDPIVAGLAMAFSALPVVANSARMARLWARVDARAPTPPAAAPPAPGPAMAEGRGPAAVAKR